MNTHVFMTLTPFLRHHLLTVAPLLWSASFVPGRPLSLREPGRPWGPAKPCRICGSITCAPPPSRPGRWRRSTRQLAERKKMTKVSLLGHTEIGTGYEVRCAVCCCLGASMRGPHLASQRRIVLRCHALHNGMSMGVLIVLCLPLWNDVQPGIAKTRGRKGVWRRGGSRLATKWGLFWNLRNAPICLLLLRPQIPMVAS